MQDVWMLLDDSELLMRIRCMEPTEDDLRLQKSMYGVESVLNETLQRVFPEDAHRYRRIWTADLKNKPEYHPVVHSMLTSGGYKYPDLDLETDPWATRQVNKYLKYLRSFKKSNRNR
jgi:hypothetical protein